MKIPLIEINGIRLTAHQSVLLQELVEVAANTKSTAEYFEPIKDLMDLGYRPKTDEHSFGVWVVAWMIVMTGVMSVGIFPLLIFLRVFGFV